MKEITPTKPAFFIDRDGVINEMVLQKGGFFDSPQTVNEVKLVPGIANVIRWLNERGFLVIEVSNQPGTAKGKMSMATLEVIEERVHLLLKEEGAHIDKAYRCFHHPKAVVPELKSECDCRKPKPGLLLEAARDLNIDLRRSVILGDGSSDVEAGKKVGVKTILYLHSNDLPEKVKANHASDADFRVTSHEEAIPILEKIFLS